MTRKSNGVPYRAAVGPEALYDVVGAMQFCRMVEIGLRDTHHLLDIGCGSLRAGRLLIPYLLPGHYSGIEPRRDLVRAGIRAELGEGILRVKSPRFLYRLDFDASSLNTQFDFALCQSVFTHISADRVLLCLQRVAEVLKPDGVLAATYLEGVQTYADGTPGYLGLARYPHKRIKDLAKTAGLRVERQSWPHPTGQTWVLFYHK